MGPGRGREHGLELSRREVGGHGGVLRQVGDGGQQPAVWTMSSHATENRPIRRPLPISTSEVRLIIPPTVAAAMRTAVTMPGTVKTIACTSRPSVTMESPTSTSTGPASRARSRHGGRRTAIPSSRWSNRGRAPEISHVTGNISATDPKNSEMPIGTSPSDAPTAVAMAKKTTTRKTVPPRRNPAMVSPLPATRNRRIHR